MFYEVGSEADKSLTVRDVPVKSMLVGEKEKLFTLSPSRFSVLRLIS